MNTFEKQLQKHAIYTPLSVHSAPIKKILAKRTYDRIAAGQMGRVYKIDQEDWVFKESRWDLSIELFRDKKLPLPAEITERVLKLFAFTFQK